MPVTASWCWPRATASSSSSSAEAQEEEEEDEDVDESDDDEEAFPLNEPERDSSAASCFAAASSAPLFLMSSFREGLEAKYPVQKQESQSE